MTDEQAKRIELLLKLQVMQLQNVFMGVVSILGCITPEQTNEGSSKQWKTMLEESRKLVVDVLAKLSAGKPDEAAAAMLRGLKN